MDRHICLIRHGKTAGNLLGRYIGTTDEPLCPAGIRALEGIRIRDVSKIYASPLKRCVQTAGIIWPDKTPARIDELRECDFGEFENKNYKELSGNAAYQAWIDSGGLLPFPGGEDTESFRSRCREGFLRLVQDMEDNEIFCAAAVCHGGTIMSILEKWGRPRKGFYDWHVENGSGYWVTVPKRWDGVQAFSSWTLLDNIAI